MSIDRDLPSELWPDVAPAVGVGFGNRYINRLCMAIWGPAQVGVGGPADGQAGGQPGPGRGPGRPPSGPPTGPRPGRHMPVRRRRRHVIVRFCRVHRRPSWARRLVAHLHG